MEKCKYRLPCGWCDRKNERCEITYGYSVNPVTISKLDSPLDKLESCAHQWECVGMNSVGTQYRCKLCGQTKTEYSIKFSNNTTSHNSAL